MPFMDPCPGRGHERAGERVRERIGSRRTGFAPDSGVRSDAGPWAGTGRPAGPATTDATGRRASPGRPTTAWPGRAPMTERKRILTGIRPTGALHLGHYAGALENWVRLQYEYEAYFLIADYQVSDYADDISRVRDSVWEVALDWLGVGLDPERSSFFIESLIPEH